MHEGHDPDECRDKPLNCDDLATVRRALHDVNVTLRKIWERGQWPEGAPLPPFGVWSWAPPCPDDVSSLIGDADAS